MLLACDTQRVLLSGVDARPPLSSNKKRHRKGLSFFARAPTLSRRRARAEARAAFAALSQSSVPGPSFTRISMFDGSATGLAALELLGRNGESSSSSMPGKSVVYLREACC